MRIAWCPQHRGVMRISFFDPPQPHFRSPCPRCQGVLVEQVRNKYELTNPGAKVEKEIVYMEFPHQETICKFFDDTSDEVVTPAPRSVCACCYTLYSTDYNGFEYRCNWCMDCPTDYCDVPTKILEKARKNGPK